MTDLEGALDRLRGLLAEVDALDESVRSLVYEVLDGVDLVHRMALVALADQLGAAVVDAAQADEAVAWLVGAYALDVADQRAAAEGALQEVLPYVHSHGGDVEVLEAAAGVVRVRMSGACSGCTASAITLQQGVETALREHVPGFVGLEVADDDAPAHPPPGPTLLQIEPLSPRAT